MTIKFTIRADPHHVEKQANPLKTPFQKLLVRNRRSLRKANISSAKNNIKIKTKNPMGFIRLASPPRMPTLKKSPLLRLFNPLIQKVSEYVVNTTRGTSTIAPLPTTMIMEDIAAKKAEKMLTLFSGSTSFARQTVAWIIKKLKIKLGRRAASSEKPRTGKHTLVNTLYPYG
ncbi:MAG: hypothetical protein QXO67_02945 [Candidatus Bathyarchaeia archaeon]